MSELQKGLLPPTEAYPWVAADVDIDLLLELSRRTCQPGNQYRLGGKAPRLSADSATIAGLGIDCSGYVRWLLFRATGDELVIPDGSVNQGDWADAVGLKESEPAACLRTDGALRLAQWRNPGGVGHIALVHNGHTMESHGGAGPARRVWGNTGWQASSRVWVLTPPTY